MQEGSTSDVEAFLKKMAIAYNPNPSKEAEFRWYAIAVFFKKNALTPRASTRSQYRTRVVESAIRKSKKVIRKNLAQVVWRGSLVWDLELLFLPIPIQNDDKKDLPK